MFLYLTQTGILNEIEKNKRAELYLINKMTLIKRSWFIDVFCKSWSNTGM